MGDDSLQKQLTKIRMNNVRIFDAMIACVNANREPKYVPVMDEEMEELTEISRIIGRHACGTI